MENKNKILLTSLDALKKNDELNRFLYKLFISRVSKAIVSKALYTWKIKSQGVPEVLKDFDMNWPLGNQNKVSGFLCLNKSLANLFIHYLLGGSDKKYNKNSHDQLTQMDTKILEKFLDPVFDFLKTQFHLDQDSRLQPWIDDNRLLPFITPGHHFYAFEIEIKFDEEIFPFLIMSHQFKVDEL